MARGNRRNGEMVVAAAPRSEPAKVAADPARLYGGMSAQTAVLRSRMIVEGFHSRLAEQMSQTKRDADSGDVLFDQNIKAAGILSAADQRALVYAAQAMSDDTLNASQKKAAERARELLIVCNQGAVRKLSRRYLGHGVPMDDLTQYANVGMQTAIDKFDPGHKTSFLTYATWWMRHTISRSLPQNSGHMSLPGYLAVVKGQVELALRRLEAVGNSRPTREELYTEVFSHTSSPNTTRETIDAAMDVIGRRYVALDATFGDEAGASNLGSVIPDENINLEERIVDEETRAAVIEAMKGLTPTQRTIISRRYGLDGSNPVQAIVLQDELGLTKGQMDNHVRYAMQHLRKVMPDAVADLIRQ